MSSLCLGSGGILDSGTGDPQLLAAAGGRGWCRESPEGAAVSRGIVVMVLLLLLPPSVTSRASLLHCRRSGRGRVSAIATPDPVWRGGARPGTCSHFYTSTTLQTCLEILGQISISSLHTLHALPPHSFIILKNDRPMHDATNGNGNNNTFLFQRQLVSCLCIGVSADVLMLKCEEE